MSEWQPIETAPKDGTPILALYNNNLFEEHMVVFWSPKTYTIGDQEIEYEWEVALGDNHISAGRVTMWMPLPALPEAAQ